MEAVRLESFHRQINSEAKSKLIVLGAVKCYKLTFRIKEFI